MLSPHNSKALKRVSILFGFAFFLLLAAGVLAFVSLKQADESKNWVDHTRAVIERVDAFFFALKTTEDAQHALLLDRDRHSLWLSQAALSGLRTNAAQIRNLTVDNRSQQKRLDRLDALVSQLVDLEPGVEAYLKGTSPPIAVAALDDSRKRLVEKIKILGSQMRDEEYQLLRTRAERARTASRLTRTALAAALATALTLLAVAAFGLYRETELRDRARRALEISERRYSTLFANRTNAIAHCRVLYDAAGKPVDYRIMQVNAAYESVTGLRKQDVEGKLARELFPGHEAEPFDFIGKYGLIARDGGEIGFEIYFEPLGRWFSIYAYSPEQGEFTAIFTDITAQKKAEEALRTSERRFRQLAENIQEVFWVLDPKGFMLYVSPAYERVWGRSSEVLYSDARHWIEAVDGADRERVRSAFAAAIETGNMDETFAISRPDGSRARIWNRGWPVRNEDGVMYRVVGVAEDITKRHEAEEEVRRLNAELEQRVAQRTAELETTNQDLEAFSYSVSHDLRAPLRGIDGFARILLEDYAPQLEPKPHRYLQLVRASAIQMGKLVDDLLHFSQLKRRDLKPQPVNVEELVREVWEELQPERDGRRLELLLGELPGSAGEPAMLKQVWFNLLANAVKFTRKRENARIEVGCWQNTGEETKVYFVRDNGVGFDMQYAGEMFNVFHRLHRAEDYEGTGVGLAIVQRIIRRHGGEVAAESAPDKGATFYFTIDGALPQLKEKEAHLAYD